MSDDNVMDHEVYIVYRQVGVKRFVSLSVQSLRVLLSKLRVNVLCILTF